MTDPVPIVAVMLSTLVSIPAAATAAALVVAMIRWSFGFSMPSIVAETILIDGIDSTILVFHHRLVVGRVCSFWKWVLRRTKSMRLLHFSSRGNCEWLEQHNRLSHTWPVTVAKHITCVVVMTMMGAKM